MPTEKNTAQNYVRPRLPHEHPTWRDNLRFCAQNIAKRTIYRKKLFVARDEALRAYFAREERVFSAEIRTLAEYFVQSFQHYAYHNGSRANFPGYPSLQGADSDSIEGAARSFPLLAAYLRAYGDDASVTTQAIQSQLRQAFLTLTNPEEKGYWGKLRDYSQIICETADFALALWLSKASIWATYNPAEKTQIISWLQQVNHVQTVGNNWHLFVLLTQTVIRDLTGTGELAAERYAQIKALYVGAGWFRDGVVGNFDYYNSWGFHYPLFWIDQIDPTFDRAFIRGACDEFAQKFKYFFTSEGFPFFGRSAPYRFAAPCALVAQMVQSGQPDGEVKRILQTLHCFFIAHGAVAKGTFTQGIFQENRLLLDNYSGSGSSLWSLRALIILLYAGMDLDAVAPLPLAVERGDFDFVIPNIHLRLIGHQETNEVIAIFLHNDYPQAPYQDACLKRQGIMKRLIEGLIGRSTREKNNLLRKGVTTYSSKLNLFLE